MGSNVETRLRARARRQHGVFTLGQALESGFTRPVVRRRLASGAWEELEPRTYRVAAAPPIEWRQRLMALTLATGGVASGRSAGALYELVPVPPKPEVLVHRLAHAARHPFSRTTLTLPWCDTTHVTGIPATAPARTLIDLAASLSRAAFEDVLDDAIVRRIVSARRLEERARALWTPRRRGCAVVLGLLETRHPLLARTRNRWEARVLRAVRRCGLPEPVPDHRLRVGGRTRYLDVAWPAVKVAIEFDGFVPHSTRRSFDEDRLRQNDLVAAGWAVFRLTATGLSAAPDAALAPVIDCLRERSR